MERYEDFRSVTEAALRSAVRQIQIQVSEAQLASLMRAYLFPSAFSDVKPGLESLKGIPLAILSNGTPEMLESAVRHNALESSFDEIISVDRCGLTSRRPGFTRSALKPFAFGRPRCCLFPRTGGMSQEQVLLVIWFAGATGPMPKANSWTGLWT
jgi:2-haloacid dehalogenase